MSVLFLQFMPINIVVTADDRIFPADSYRADGFFERDYGRFYDVRLDIMTAPLDNGFDLFPAFESGSYTHPRNTVATCKCCEKPDYRSHKWDTCRDRKERIFDRELRKNKRIKRENQQYYVEMRKQLESGPTVLDVIAPIEDSEDTIHGATFEEIDAYYEQQLYPPLFDEDGNLDPCYHDEFSYVDVDQLHYEWEDMFPVNLSVHDAGYWIDQDTELPEPDYWSEQRHSDYVEFSFGTFRVTDYGYDDMPPVFTYSDDPYYWADYEMYEDEYVFNALNDDPYDDLHEQCPRHDSYACFHEGPPEGFDPEFDNSRPDWDLGWAIHDCTRCGEELSHHDNNGRCGDQKGHFRQRINQTQAKRLTTV